MIIIKKEYFEFEIRYNYHNKRYNEYINILFN